MFLTDRNARAIVRRAAATLLIAIAVALVPARTEATPLDKLAGQSITVGNLVFSNFSWPFFTGAGPSNIDVQAIVVTDPVTGLQQAGLRFVVIQSNVPSPFALSPQGGPHEIGFTIDYSVTDTSGQLAAMSQRVQDAVVGQAGVLFSTNGSGSLAVTEGSLADPTLTMLISCNWFGSTCSGSSSASSTSYAIVGSGGPTESAPLFPGFATYYVQHHADLQISNRKGVTAGTATLWGWDALFNQ